MVNIDNNNKIFVNLYKVCSIFALIAVFSPAALPAGHFRKAIKLTKMATKEAWKLGKDAMHPHPISRIKRRHQKENAALAHSLFASAEKQDNPANPTKDSNIFRSIGRSAAKDKKGSGLSHKGITLSPYQNLSDSVTLSDFFGSERTASDLFSESIVLSLSGSQLGSSIGVNPRDSFDKMEGINPASSDAEVLPLEEPTSDLSTKPRSLRRLSTSLGSSKGEYTFNAADSTVIESLESGPAELQEPDAPMPKKRERTPEEILQQISQLPGTQNDLTQSAYVDLIIDVGEKIDELNEEFRKAVTGLPIDELSPLLESNEEVVRKCWQEVRSKQRRSMPEDENLNGSHSEGNDLLSSSVLLSLSQSGSSISIQDQRKEGLAGDVEEFINYIEGKAQKLTDRLPSIKDKDFMEKLATIHRKFGKFMLRATEGVNLFAAEPYNAPDEVCNDLCQRVAKLSKQYMRAFNRKLIPEKSIVLYKEALAQAPTPEKCAVIVEHMVTQLNTFTTKLRKSRDAEKKQEGIHRRFLSFLDCCKAIISEMPGELQSEALEKIKGASDSYYEVLFNMNRVSLWSSSSSTIVLQ